MIQPEHVRPGGVVVGAGVRYEGRKLLPDVDEACEDVAGWITPRVGGVGPTTIAMLFANLVGAAERRAGMGRSEEHTSELQSLMRISYAVFCLTNKKKKKHR